MLFYIYRSNICSKKDEIVMAKIIQFKSKAQLQQEAREEIEREWLAFLESEHQMLAENEVKTARDIFAPSDEINDMKF